MHDEAAAAPVAGGLLRRHAHPSKQDSVNPVTLSKVFWEPDLVIARQATPT